ncbi:MAG TPA: hypothetical protein VG943_00510 [Caulobacterales bacterium]|nr:hypothetical protein [Caulobacterales bacterium]
MAEWPAGWRDTESAEAGALAEDISNALSPTHILRGRAFRVLARRSDADDVLLQLDDGEVAEMHLSWASQVSASFPGAILYVDLDQWRAAQF